MFPFPQPLNTASTPFLPKPNAETKSDKERERKSECDPSSHRSVARATAGVSSPSPSLSSTRAVALRSPAVMTSVEPALLSPRLFPPPLNLSRASPSEEPPPSLLVISLRAVDVHALSLLPFHGDTSPSLSDGGRGCTRRATAAGLLFCHCHCHVMEEEIALPPSELAVAVAHIAAAASLFYYYFLIVMPSALPLQVR